MRNNQSDQVVVTVLTSAAQTLSSLRSLTDWADHLYLAYAWAASNQGRAEHWKTLPLHKIRKAVIGVHFAQTEPWVFSALSKLPGALRVVEDTAGVFHPKILVGTKGQEAAALIGSSNFTEGGFRGNTELNVLLEGPLDSTAFANIIDFVEAEWRGPRSFAPDADWMACYEIAYAQRPPLPRIPPPANERATVKHARDLEVPWHEYYELIAAQERRTLANGAPIHVFDHGEGSYLEEADACQDAFARYPTFAEMPPAAKKRVAGLPPESSGYFGRMGGAGNFKLLVRTRPEDIGHFLDPIPLTGRIPREQVEHCLAGLTALQGFNIATASRLLSMKRQDLFLPLNNANRTRIRELFGRIPNTIKGYLALQDRIARFPWMHAPEPSDENEQRVWRARAALLDALLYEAPSSDSPPPGYAPDEQD